MRLEKDLVGPEFVQTVLDLQDLVKIVAVRIHMGGGNHALHGFHTMSRQRVPKPFITIDLAQPGRKDDALHEAFGFCPGKFFDCRKALLDGPHLATDQYAQHSRHRNGIGTIGTNPMDRLPGPCRSCAAGLVRLC